MSACVCKDVCTPCWLEILNLVCVLEYTAVDLLDLYHGRST
jgi:hypothetical protein